MSDSNALMETAVFGRRVEEFMASDLGRYLVLKAESQEQQATEELKKLSPWTPMARRAMQKIQNDIRVAEWFQQWLGEAVMDGLQATNILEDEHHG